MPIAAILDRVDAYELAGLRHYKLERRGVPAGSSVVRMSALVRFDLVFLGGPKHAKVDVFHDNDLEWKEILVTPYHADEGREEESVRALLECVVDILFPPC